MKLAALTLVIALPSIAHAGAGDRWDGVMITEQTLAGIGGGALVGGAFMLGGALIGNTFSEGKRDWGPGLVGGVIGGSIGLEIGITLGVKIAGDYRGGNGSWLVTASGALGGGLFALATAPSYVDAIPTWASASLIAISLLAPPIVAYQLSTDEENADTEQRFAVPLVVGVF